MKADSVQANGTAVSRRLFCSSSVSTMKSAWRAKWHSEGSRSIACMGWAPPQSSSGTLGRTPRTARIVSSKSISAPSRRTIRSRWGEAFSLSSPLSRQDTTTPDEAKFVIQCAPVLGITTANRSSWTYTAISGVLHKNARQSRSDTTWPGDM